MIIRLLNNKFAVYIYAFLLLTVLIRSSSGLEIQVNQPGTLILSVRLDSVWIDENGNIQSFPKLKSLIRPEYPSIPYISETLVGVSPDAILNYFPDDERVIPISTELKLGTHESPKGMELPDNIPILFQFQEQSQLATLNTFPDIKRRTCAVLKIFPISVDENLNLNPTFFCGLPYTPTIVGTFVELLYILVILAFHPSTSDL